jgi:hypothetical protein
MTEVGNFAKENARVLWERKYVDFECSATLKMQRGKFLTMTRWPTLLSRDDTDILYVY